jgi:hypothetical protein
MLIFRANASSAGEGAEDEEATGVASPEDGVDDPWVADFPKGIGALQEADDNVTATKTEALKNPTDFRERDVTQTLRVHSARSAVA